jgi:quinol monooxygenase YgiN
MIHVIATIQLKPACREDYLKILGDNVPKVKAEDGCLAYEPAIDTASGLPVQGPVRSDVVTILEAWQSLDALRAHLQTPHMTAYREAVKDCVVDIKVQVLQPV